MSNVKLPKIVDDADEEDSDQYYAIRNELSDARTKRRLLPSTLSSHMNEETTSRLGYDSVMDDLNDSELNTNYNKRPNINISTMQYLESQPDLVNAIRIGFIIYPSKGFIKQLYERQPDSIKFSVTKELEASSESVSKKQFDDYSTHMRQKQKQYMYDFLLIKYLNMSLKHIIEVGDLFVCENIRILNLANNYLFDLEPLRNCCNLYRLDLSTNQVIIHF